MSNFKKAAAITGAVAATITMTATSAFATGTYVKVGSSATGTHAVTGVNTTSINFESDFGVPMECANSAVTAEIYAGTHVTIGAVIGKIKSLTFSSCTATDLGYPVVVTKNPGDWDIVVAAEPSGPNSAVAVTIRGVSADVDSVGSAPLACEFGATGDVPATFTPGSGTPGGTLAINSGTATPLNLSAYSGAGTNSPAAATCGGQIYTGDKASMVGTFAVNTVSPAGQAITHN